jgi:hypothetical protein
MQFVVKPSGKEYRFDQESDIIDVIYTNSGLRITVMAATTMFTNVYLDIHFSFVAGFRLLDERDLLGYWESRAFNSNHHVYEILSGGWTNGEALQAGLFTNAIESREWFIKTTNKCMNILSSEEPQIREIKNPSISYIKDEGNAS